uniref:Uncharacterized protein n=1 Tax=Anopheles culicifacies TaxID=139723 RepID=A0A182M741_9DIPT
MFKVLKNAQILLRSGFVRFPRDEPETSSLLRRTVVRVEWWCLLVARLIRVTGFAEVGHEVQHCLVDTHVLAREVLRKGWSTLHERQSEDLVVAPGMLAPHWSKAGSVSVLIGNLCASEKWCPFRFVALLEPFWRNALDLA